MTKSKDKFLVKFEAEVDTVERAKEILDSLPTEGVKVASFTRVPKPDKSPYDVREHN